jgi:chromosome segregation ATPase
VEDLLTFLTTKFNKLIDSLKSEELEKRQLQRQCLEQQLRMQSYEDFEQVLAVQETMREHANYKQRLIHLEHELAVT